MPGYGAQVVNYQDALQSLTLQAVDKGRVFDQFFNNAPFFEILRQRKREQYGGLFVQKQFSVSKSANTTWYQGAGGWTIAPYEGFVDLAWNWCYLHDGIAVTGPEIVVNQDSDEAIVGLVQARLDNANLSAVDYIASAMINNNPYGNNADSTTGNPLGFEGLAVLVDNGTISNTVGQVSRTAYPTLNSQVNYTNTLNASFLSTIQTLNSSANRGSVSRVNMHLTSEGAYNYYWGLLQPNERYSMDPRVVENTLRLKNTGGENLAFNNAPIFYDTHVPTGVPSPQTTVGSGGYWYGLNLDTFEFFHHPDRFFANSEFYKDIYGDVYYLDIYLAGGLVCEAPNRNFVTWIAGA
jgi:hypothetical protein